MKRVLMVDDELAVVSVFETALRSAGYETKVAADAKAGLDLAQKEKFDLILLDQMLPDMSGNELLKAMKADDTIKNTPIAMLTNFGQEQMIKDALAAGASEYILKYQISTDDLVTKVKGIIGS